MSATRGLSSSTEAQEGGTVAMESSLRTWVDAAIVDLAKRLKMDRKVIAVVEVRRVTWPDSSLGCPRPGMAYPQVPQDGVLIRLHAAGREYSYHGGGLRAPFLCSGT